MSRSWIIGSDTGDVPIPRLPLDPGRTFLAEVIIYAEDRADERRVVCYDGVARAVRDLSGRLYWLESPEGYALRKQPSAGPIVAVPPEVDVVIPAGVGVEALAVIDLKSLCDWTGGRPSFQSGAEVVHVNDSDWGPLLVTLSRQGSIRSVGTRTSPPRTILAAVRVRFVPRQGEWFRAADVNLDKAPWPW